MSLSTTLSNVLISGNTICDGYGTSDGVGSVLYTYGTGIYTAADAKIISNTISGLTNNSSTSIGINTLGNCDISGNYFIRGNAGWAAYVQGDNSHDSIVVDNIFDSSTVDGTNETLVTSLTVSSIYERNKNQTGYIGVPLYEILQATTNAGNYGFGTLLNGTGVLIGNFNGGLASDTFYGVQNASGTAVHSTSLNKYLPINVRVIAAVAGFNHIAGTDAVTTTAATNLFSLWLSKNTSNVWSVGSPSGSSADASLITNDGLITDSTIASYVGGTGSATFTVTSGNTASFTSGSLYCSLDSAIPSDYIINKNYNLRGNYSGVICLLS